MIRTLNELHIDDITTLEEIAEAEGWDEIKHDCRDELQVRQR